MQRVEIQSSGLIVYFPQLEIFHSSQNQPINVFLEILNNTRLKNGFIAVCVGDTRGEPLFRTLSLLTNYALENQVKSQIQLYSARDFRMSDLAQDELKQRGLYGIEMQRIVEVEAISPFGSLSLPQDNTWTKIMYYQRPPKKIHEYSAIEAHYSRMIGMDGFPTLNEDFIPDVIIKAL